MSKVRSYSWTWLMIFVLIFASDILVCSECSAQIEQRIMIITGGHEFEREAFFDIFREMPGVDYREVVQPEANKLWDSTYMDQFDVLLFYDMFQEIDGPQKAAFIRLLEKGKGVVFLHHSLASHQTWYEYKRIIGGRYLETGSDQEKSTYKHDVEVPVQIADHMHPITEGLNDFLIHDEVYGNFRVLPTVHPILRTTHPESGELIGWTNRYGNSRIVYIQLGHDQYAYENPNYRRLLRQALDWARQPDEVKMVRYSPEYTFKDGLYLNIDDVKANDPIPFGRIVTDLNSYNKAFFKEMIINEEITLYDESGVRASLKTKDLWGYALNGQLYIMLGGKFQKIIIEGRISLFMASATTHEKTRYAPSDTNTHYTTTEDLYRSYNKKYYYSMVTAEGTMSLFDFESNNLTGYDIKSLGVLLERDSELSAEYEVLRNREKKEKMMEFIRKFNATHPLYFPVQEP
ncbi:MAG: ThuA domain-containing protein [Bacteroidota bacterium]|nr:ThuA domain-containing protein [Bacteroidota bacterium]